MVRIISSVALVALIVASVGCPKQSSSSTSGDEAPAPVAKKSRFSGETKTFVDALMANGIVGYDVADEGASVVYETVELGMDGSYEAASTLRLGDEDPFSCVESGTWTLDNDEAVGAAEAMVTFDMQATDCPGRTAPKSWRAKLEISGSDVIVSSF